MFIRVKSPSATGYPGAALWKMAVIALGIVTPNLGRAEPGKLPAAAHAREQAAELRAAGHTEQAIELLKQARLSAPRDQNLAVELAWAYLADDNEFWALRTLSQCVEKCTQSCGARALTAWIELRLANLDSAEQALAAPSCEAVPEERARFEMLRALIAEQRHDRTEATRHTEQALTGQAYAEDLPLLERIEQQYLPGRMPVLTGEIGVTGGFTSNALSGSPLDSASTSSAPSSGLVLVDLRAQAVLPTGSWLRPVLSAQARLSELTSDSARDLSFEEPTLSAGVLVGRAHPRLQLSYVLDAVRLHSSDTYDSGPQWYSEAHRLRWQWEPSPRVLVFGALGRRWFRYRARTRTEAEQGAAATVPVSRQLGLLGAVSARWHKARAEAYDLWGSTLLVNLGWQLMSALRLDWALSVSADVYPHSRGWFVHRDYGRRRDLLERSNLGLSFDLNDEVRAGPSYELWHRMSTAEPYAFVDHRVLANVAWHFDSDRTRTVGTEGRAAMQWSRPGVHQGDDAHRIEQLLHQDDLDRQGSSCLK